jgi:hypothetical protein
MWRLAPRVSQKFANCESASCEFAFGDASSSQPTRIPPKTRIDVET